MPFFLSFWVSPPPGIKTIFCDSCVFCSCQQTKTVFCDSVSSVLSCKRQNTRKPDFDPIRAALTTVLQPPWCLHATADATADATAHFGTPISFCSNIVKRWSLFLSFPLVRILHIYLRAEKKNQDKLGCEDAKHKMPPCCPDQVVQFGV